jgi:hypothetical protein
VPDAGQLASCGPGPVIKAGNGRQAAGPFQPRDGSLQEDIGSGRGGDARRIAQRPGTGGTPAKQQQAPLARHEQLGD